ncbi:hypothetical protein Pmani_012001 [Petrolisthes manimaculis]|uniref:Uncharacterized protein n=1 Tax=Petrolisthes manimaculis TaxID=1843537 RepID=A0AAE1UF37_9EUCA|nr:hypothetical protein Pmani_012001 [Petrolisthes manimaculis]
MPLPGNRTPAHLISSHRWVEVPTSATSHNAPFHTKFCDNMEDPPDLTASAPSTNVLKEGPTNQPGKEEKEGAIPCARGRRREQ